MGRPSGTPLSSWQRLPTLLAAAGLLLLALGGWMALTQERIPNQDNPRIPPGKTMAGKVLWLRPLPQRPQAILILASGYNDRTGNLIRNPLWQNFAREHRLALGEASFASPLDQLAPGKQGYYYPEHGSGKTLQDALQKEFGPPEDCPPLLLFGFSGGAIFLARFQAWTQYPVAAWCALAGGRFPTPRPTQAPALLLCGDEDERLPANRHFLQLCRKSGAKAQLQELHQCGHVMDYRSFEAAQLFFLRILQENPNSRKIPPITPISLPFR